MSQDLDSAPSLKDTASWPCVFLLWGMEWTWAQTDIFHLAATEVDIEPIFHEAHIEHYYAKIEYFSQINQNLKINFVWALSLSQQLHVCTEKTRA